MRAQIRGARADVGTAIYVDRTLGERMRAAGGLRVDDTDEGLDPREGADLLFAPGALDGIVSRHGGGGLELAAVDLAEQTTAALTSATRGTLTRDKLLALYAAAQSAPTDGPSSAT